MTDHLTRKQARDTSLYTIAKYIGDCWNSQRLSYCTLKWLFSQSAPYVIELSGSSLIDLLDTHSQKANANYLMLLASYSKT